MKIFIKVIGILMIYAVFIIPELYLIPLLPKDETFIWGCLRIVILFAIVTPPYILSVFFERWFDKRMKITIIK